MTVEMEGTVRIGPIMSIPSLLESLGVDPAIVLKEADLDPRLFGDPDNVISFRARSHLVKLCVDHTGCQHFGLLLGQNHQLPSFGHIGYLAMNSTDVESALRSLVRHFHLHGQGSAVTLEISGDLACWSYFIYQSNTEVGDQLEDAAIGMMYLALRQLCGEGWVPDEICFNHRKPLQLKAFKNYFRAPPRFDADCSGIYFKASWLKQAVPGADPILRGLLRKTIDDMEASFREDFPEQVRRALHSALLTKHARADQVAEIFSMHSRTLHRRLAEHGTSFREIADQCRYTIARQLLDTADMGTDEIAAVLGYADARSFSRAFRRWCGVTPVRWRDNH